MEKVPHSCIFFHVKALDLGKDLRINRCFACCFPKQELDFFSEEQKNEYIRLKSYSKQLSTQSLLSPSATVRRILTIYHEDNDQAGADQLRQCLPVHHQRSGHSCCVGTLFSFSHSSVPLATIAMRAAPVPSVKVPAVALSAESDSMNLDRGNCNCKR